MFVLPTQKGMFYSFEKIKLLVVFLLIGGMSDVYNEIREILEKNKRDALNLNPKAIERISEAYMKLYKLTGDFNYETISVSLRRYGKELRDLVRIYDWVVRDSGRDISASIERLENLLKEKSV